MGTPITQHSPSAQPSQATAKRRRTPRQRTPTNGPPTRRTPPWHHTTQPNHPGERHIHNPCPDGSCWPSGIPTPRHPSGTAGVSTNASADFARRAHAASCALSAFLSSRYRISFSPSTYASSNGPASPGGWRCGCEPATVLQKPTRAAPGSNRRCPARSTPHRNGNSPAPQTPSRGTHPAPGLASPSKTSCIPTTRSSSTDTSVPLIVPPGSSNTPSITTPIHERANIDKPQQDRQENAWPWKPSTPHPDQPYQ